MKTLAQLVVDWAQIDGDVADKGWTLVNTSKWDVAKANMVKMALDELDEESKGKLEVCMSDIADGNDVMGRDKKMICRDMDRFIGMIPGGGIRDRLENMGYFDAPASGSHHLAERSGLAVHSVNVTRWLLKLTKEMDVKWPRPESPYIVGMLHDLVKAKTYAFQKCGAEEKIIRVPQPYTGHGAASAIIAGAELGVRLFPAEASAIVHHMGAFHLEGYDLKDFDGALSLFPKEIIATHTADMLAARWDEDYDHENLH